MLTECCNAPIVTSKDGRSCCYGCYADVGESVEDALDEVYSELSDVAIRKISEESAINKFDNLFMRIVEIKNKMICKVVKSGDSNEK